MPNDGPTPVTHAEGPPADGARAGLYVPRILQQHLASDTQGRWWAHEGTAVFSDISGFTKLSEQLARKGREGSEQITEVIGKCFESILAVAYDNGASLLKFGGDALLLWFQDSGHAVRACRAAVLMRRALRDVGRIDMPGAKTTLRMSQGIHSGNFHFFMAGATHHELVVAGPAWSRVVSMEHVAEASEILVSPETAALLPARCLGAVKSPGTLLQREPPGKDKLPLIPRPIVPHETLARCLSPAVRAHVMGGGGAPEHRPVTVAFIKFEGIDAMIATQGPEAAAVALDRVVTVVESATEAQRIALLASDIDIDGGKLILTAGAPIVTGEDEERMLLALRAIVDARLPIPIRIGVNRGAIFAGDIGPFYRRTYTVMGDVVNLAARLMAKAQPGRIYATADVLERSNTTFQTTALEPFMVKGKAKPIEAWDVGKAIGSRTLHGTLQALPLTGRDVEMATLREALTAARAGHGQAFELVGETGIGKTRLVNALSEEATDFTIMHAVCEAYTASIPYSVWQEVFRELVGIGRDETEDVVAARVREIVVARAPALLPWLPLVAIAFGAEVPSTPEVDMLAEKNRRPKLHESIVEFIAAVVPGAALMVLENAHHIDVASRELFAHIAQSATMHPWVIVAARRPVESETGKPVAAVKRIELAALSGPDTLRLVKFAAEQHPLPLHVIDVIAQRSGGNPQFLRDLMRVAIDSGGVDGLPDSAEAATMARIDALTPSDRTLLRRAAVFGLTFHPRMLDWLEDGEDVRLADSAAWQRLHEFFDDEGDGYLRFRRALIRDVAYQGLPYKLRRQLHRTAAQRLQAEAAQPDEAAGILSLHYFEAGDFEQAWQFSPIAAKRAEVAFAYVEAAGLYARAVESARRLRDVPRKDLALVCRSLGDAWLRATEYQKASAAFVLARRVNAGTDPVLESVLLLFQSRVEEKMGQYQNAMRWAARARRRLHERTDVEALRQLARSSAWYATVLQLAGRPREAVRCAERAVSEALPIEDHDALADAYLVIGWARGAQGLEGAERYWKLALESAERAGRWSLRPALLINFGLACQWKGRWDEAIGYYEQGRDESVRIGSNVNAMLARLNIAEILIDRSEWAKANDLMRETLPFFKAARYRFFLGACLVLVGRVHLGMGHLDDAFASLQESKNTFVAIGAADEIPGVDARIAQCLVYQGKPKEAIAIADAVLAHVGQSNAITKLVPLLQRVRALALYTKGDDAGALKAARASLAAATDPKDAFEVALTSYFIMAFDRAAGRASSPEIVAQGESLLAKFGLREAPVIPEVVTAA